MDRKLLEPALLAYRDERVCMERVPSKNNEIGVFAHRKLLPGTEIGDYVGATRDYVAVAG